MSCAVWYKSAVKLVLILYNYQLNSINVIPLRWNYSAGVKK
jgi:hypothetical protein